MPYYFEREHIKLPEGKDRRVKLTPNDKELIVELYNTGEFSTYKLAEIFEVSRRTIQFVLDPEKRKANKERLEERGGWKTYYDKDKQIEYMKGHRNYKKKVLEEK